MDRDTLIGLIKWTMKHYGSDAGERANPGSKLQSQAEHIAEVIAEYDEAGMRLQGLQHVRIELFRDYIKE